jgi:hypothetical protein
MKPKAHPLCLQCKLHVGPQLPASHGVLRLILSMHGEQIVLSKDSHGCSGRGCAGVILAWGRSRLLVWRAWQRNAFPPLPKRAD